MCSRGQRDSSGGSAGTEPGAVERAAEAQLGRDVIRICRAEAVADRAWRRATRSRSPCELQRDWAREETVPEMVQIVLTERPLKE
jgi:hypothetical protein